MLDLQTLLIVDDALDNLELLYELLKDKYKIKAATNGEKALAIARQVPHPDLILLDVMMPGISGHDVCRALKADEATKTIPVVFLTAASSPKDEALGLDLGAADFITKPVNPPVLLARVETQLNAKRVTDLLRDQADFLASEVEKRTHEISVTQDVSMLAMASLAETRDASTGNHIRRTQFYVKELAQALKDHPKFNATLTPKVCELISKSASLHDIGKIGIPDSILLKRGKLSEDEFEIMKTHTTLGKNAIETAEKWLGTTAAFLQTAKEIAYSHQEKWDGSGYPQGLKGEDIPISARLMALADVYDALVSERPYKKAFPHEQAVEMIKDGSGKHFDPDVVDAFLLINCEFKAIAERLADNV